jgi:hypothetical protein
MWKSACWATNQVVSFVQWSWKVMQPVRQFAWDIGVACWDGLCYVKNQAVSFVQWCWNATQPVRQLAWDTTVAVLTWSANRIIDLWNITWPLRSFVKWVVRDIVIDKVVWNLILEDNHLEGSFKDRDQRLDFL